MLSWSRLLVVPAVLGLTASWRPGFARAQDVAAPAPASSTIAVFLDCRLRCDAQYIRTEIAYVNWVRDRTAADVHVLITSQDAGGGGEAFTLAFMGLRDMAGRGDTLTFTTNATTTDDEERRGITQTLALGLVQFVARSPGALALRITRSGVAPDAPGTQTMPASDPWRAWVFEIDLGADVRGERTDQNREFDSEFNANRTTEAWKTIFEASYGYDSRRAIDENYENGVLVSVDTFTNVQRNWSTELIMVKSVTGHLSAGFRSAIASNTFRNQKRRIELMPAVEYNLFPYSESTRRYLALQLAAGVDNFVYADTTIFDKLRETFPLYYSALIYSTRQPWGQSNVRLEHRGYLNDVSKRSTQLSGNMSVRIFRGLSARFGGGYSWIHDQVYLVKTESDQADVLLRRRALLTGFEYNAFVGLTYTFGSIFNNVVNPRFF